MSTSPVTITWLGHSTFRLGTPEGKTILVDPWLSGNPKCPPSFHQADSDAILITHGHFDHCGDAVEASGRCRGPVVGNFELTNWLKSEGVEESKLIGMNKGGRVRLDDLKVTVSMTDAKHSSSAIKPDGSIVYLGEAAGYVVEFSDGFTLYLAGDTCLFGDMQWIARLYQPRAAVLPIGDLYTMDPRAAAYACALLQVETVVPCHYGTFPPLIGTPAALREQIAVLRKEMTFAEPNVLELEPGVEASLT